MPASKRPASKKVASKKSVRAASAQASSGFPDFNFKLAVLSALMDDGHYVKQAKALKTAHAGAAKDYKPIQQVIAFYESIVIPQEKLATVTSLQPDGGDLAYVYAMNVWDGEDDQFNIASIEGIEQLVNLEKFSPIAMISEDGIDYRPILGCKKLKYVDLSFGVGEADDDEVFGELERRGVEVES